jgi:hypothetical protein
MAKLLDDPPWWGYSKLHGWVVLDRTIPANKSGLIMDFLFCRCHDSVTFIDKRSNWAAPRYIYASTYISSLPPVESEAATVEFNRIKALWPEFQAEINKQYQAREDERLQNERERVLKEGAKRVVKVRR